MTRTEKDPQSIEQDLQQIEQAMLKAAHAELIKVEKSDGDDVELSQLPHAILRALCAADRISQHETDVRQDKDGHDYEGFVQDAGTVVASAFWAWSQGIDIINASVSPQSDGGNRLLAFANAITAARFVSNGHALVRSCRFTDRGMYAFEDDIQPLVKSAEPDKIFANPHAVDRAIGTLIGF